MKTARTSLLMLALGCMAGTVLAAPDAASPAASAPVVTPPAVAASAALEAQAEFDRGMAALCNGRQARNAAELAKSARWLTLAAEHGHTRAQSVLGWMYLSGTGVPRDDAQARRWLTQAAERGESSAQNNLGVIYAQGIGVPRDAATAERWFRAAADKGAADAQRNLQQLRGEPVKPGTRSRSARASQPDLFVTSCKGSTALQRS